MRRHTTDELLKILQSLNTAEALSDYTASAEKTDSGISFPAFISGRAESVGLSAGDLIRLARIQRNYGYQILNGSRHPGRDKVISLCLALHLPLDEVQRALAIAEENALYPRRRRDAILIFAVQQQLTVDEVNQLLFELQEPVLQ